MVDSTIKAEIQMTLNIDSYQMIIVTDPALSLSDPLPVSNNQIWECGISFQEERKLQCSTVLDMNSGDSPGTSTPEVMPALSINCKQFVIVHGVKR